MSPAPDPSGLPHTLKAFPASRLAAPLPHPARSARAMAVGLAITFACAALLLGSISPSPVSGDHRATQIEFVIPTPALRPPQPAPTPDLTPPLPQPEATMAGFADTEPHPELPSLSLHYLRASRPPQAIAPPAHVFSADPSAPAAEPAAHGNPAPTADPVCAEPHARYPASARVLHEEGRAIVQVTIQPGGHVAQAAITSTSGFDDLDDTALAAARTLNCHYSGNTSRTVILPVHFDRGE